ncbi:hypothetical protein L0Y46_01120, partial [bacterium]|nr:hypothetical protein [bacterium]
MAVWNYRGEAAFARPAHSEPRKARRGQNSVRAIFKIHRQLGKYKLEEISSRRGTRRSTRACSKTLDYCEFMLRAANGGSERLKISTIFFAF